MVISFLLDEIQDFFFIIFQLLNFNLFAIS